MRQSTEINTSTNKSPYMQPVASLAKYKPGKVWRLPVPLVTGYQSTAHISHGRLFLKQSFLKISHSTDHT